MIDWFILQYYNIIHTGYMFTFSTIFRTNISIKWTDGLYFKFRQSINHSVFTNIWASSRVALTYLNRTVEPSIITDPDLDRNWGPDPNPFLDQLWCWSRCKFLIQEWVRYIRSNLFHLNCLKHLIRSRADKNRIFFLEKDIFSFMPAQYVLNFLLI